MTEDSNPLKIKSYFIPLKNQSLHLKRFYKDKNGIPVFMLHGSMENGKIFYSKSLKGLAPYLAEQGYDVFVADLSGRGLSTPSIKEVRSKNSRNQTDSILEEIPAFYSYITGLKGNMKQHWIAHSWGGVLMLSYIARFGSEGISTLSLFGTKRRISVNHIEKIIKVDVLWNVMGRIIGKIYGYFPSKELKIGSDNEPYAYYRQTVKWVYEKNWIDPEDGFDYKAAFEKAQNVPPTLYLAAKEDHYLGHPADVKNLMKEVGNPADKYILLSKDNGNLIDYDHISMLTHTKARLDQFPLLKNWIEENSLPPDKSQCR